MEVSSVLVFLLLLVTSSVCTTGQKQPRMRTLPSTSDFNNPEEPESDTDYDDKDVQFEPNPPNLLILLADPKNGTTLPLPHQPNSVVVLDRSYEKVHLFCSAYYPIKWSYSGDGFPFLNVDNTRFAEDFYDPTTYAFSALLELEGLKESQTGNYTCHKWDNVSFSSSYQIYVPGDNVFLAENNTKIYVDAAVSLIVVPCSVSDPQANVTLLKLFDKGQGEKDWIAVSPTFYTFDPKVGFTLQGSSVLTAIGDLICSVGEEHSSRLHLSVMINNTLAGRNAKISKEEDCCDKKYLRSLGDERTSCRSFISERCQAPQYLDKGRSPCPDWKVAEFLKSPVELCKQEIAPSNSSIAVGYFSTSEQGGPRLYMYCQADPKEYTQGFKMAVEWTNGSMVFVEDDRLLVPGLSEYPSGYEVHAEVTDLLNSDAPFDPIILHCYIPLKYSFKWIKILKPVPTEDVTPFAQTWYKTATLPISSSTTVTPPRTSGGPRRITTTQGSSFRKPSGNVVLDPRLDRSNEADEDPSSRQLSSSASASIVSSIMVLLLSSSSMMISWSQIVL